MVEQTNDIGLGIEIELGEPDDFLKVKETLTRIGICSNRTKTLYQTCNLLHKRGKYYVMHFKEMFKLDGKESTLSDEDVERRNTIAILLKDWGLVMLKQEVVGSNGAMKQIKVLPYSEKANWTLATKYSVGTKRSIRL